MSDTNELDFTGMTAIVTGAGRGIGREHAVQLSERGCAVVVNDIGGDVAGQGVSIDIAEAVVEEIRAKGGRAVASGESVASPEGAARIVELAVQQFGKVDVLINNAGILDNQPLMSYTTESFARHIEVHLYGTVNMTRACWPLMQAARSGRIVNTVSSAIFGLGDAAAYASAKGAIFALTSSLAVEGAAIGIKVNAISPFAKTRMLRTFDTPNSPSQTSPLALYLAHESVAINGETLFISGNHVSRIALVETRGVNSDNLTPELIGLRISDILELEGAHHWASVDARTM